MSNPKTIPSSAPKPEVQHGWVRKCDLDAANELRRPRARMSHWSHNSHIRPQRVLKLPLEMQ